MKVAIDIDKVLTNQNGHPCYAALLPVINASCREAEIIFYTNKLAILSAPEQVAQDPQRPLPDHRCDRILLR